MFTLYSAKTQTIEYIELLLFGRSFFMQEQKSYPIKDYRKDEENENNYHV